MQYIVMLWHPQEVSPLSNKAVREASPGHQDLEPVAGSKGETRRERHRRLSALSKVLRELLTCGWPAPAVFGSYPAGP